MQDYKIVKVEGLRKLFPIRKSFISSFVGKGQSCVHAVDGIHLDIRKGEIVGLAGESGCGKTTLGKLLAKLEEPTSGRILFKGRSIAELGRKDIKAFRRAVQIIFQDPYASLDPRYTVVDSVTEPLEIHQESMDLGDKAELASSMLERVGLKPAGQFLQRLPHELSGGQRQRVAIARAMILQPEMVIADEPVSMLDVSIRAGILNLMLALNKDFNTSFVFISHDLAVIRYVSDTVIILYLGKIVEWGRTDSVIQNPQHPYTKLMISAVPVPDPTYERKRIRSLGSLPSAVDPLPGCRFAPRCPYAEERCKRIEPELVETEPEHRVACSVLFPP